MDKYNFHIPPHIYSSTFCQDTDYITRIIYTHKQLKERNHLPLVELYSYIFIHILIICIYYLLNSDPYYSQCFLIRDFMLRTLQALSYSLVNIRTLALNVLFINEKSTLKRRTICDAFRYFGINLFVVGAFG